MTKAVFDMLDECKKDMANDKNIFQTGGINDINTIRSIFTDKILVYKKCIQMMVLKTNRFNLLSDNKPSDLKELDPLSA